MMCCSSLVPVIMSDSDSLSCLLQVDPGNTGKVGAAEAAQFLKKTGLSDSTLGQVRINNHVPEHLKALRCNCWWKITVFFLSLQIWDLSDPERKGYLDKKVNAIVCQNRPLHN